MRKFVVVWGNWGPYHHARFRAFRSRAETKAMVVEGIQLFPRSGIYDWTSQPTAPGVHQLDLGNDEMAFRPWFLLTRLIPLIHRLRPDVVFVPGYWHWSLFLNAVSRLFGARMVMMSESHAGTARAGVVGNWMKRAIIPTFHAALVGGTPHQRHFASLGLNPRRIHRGYDAIDNDHFRRSAERARAHAAQHRRRLGLPDRYILSLGRFVPKKNLGLLVRAFAAAKTDSRGGAMNLVFVGSGESGAELRNLCGELRLRTYEHTPGPPAAPREAASPAVHFFGFLQIDETPVLYGLATAFVLPSLHEEWGLVVNEAMACGLPVLVSSTAGCAQDLVADGVTGFLFDPADPAGLANALRTLADDPQRAARMGRASAEHISNWGCERFAEGAVRAAQSALRD